MLSLRLIRQYSVNIRPALTSAEQIRQLLATPTWSPNELLVDNEHSSVRASKIDEQTMTRLLQMSGLEAPLDDYPRIIGILKEQVRFIDHLHSVEISEEALTRAQEQEEEQYTGKRLSLEDIKRQIKDQTPDPSKGETSQSWNPMELASHSQHGNYIIREGLLKDK